MTTAKKKKKPARLTPQPAAPAAAAHGGYRPGAGRKPVVRFCNVCGAPCTGAIEARAHCAGESRK